MFCTKISQSSEIAKIKIIKLILTSKQLKLTNYNETKTKDELID